MTDFFVDDAAVGLNDGTSKTDAWASFWSITGVSAGDTIFVNKDHNENSGGSTQSLTLTGTIASKIQIVSINFTGDAPTVGAILTTNTGFIDFTLTWSFVEVFGIEFNPGDDTNHDPADGASVIHDSCTLKTQQATKSSGPFLMFLGNAVSYEFRNCTIEQTITGASNGEFSVKILGGSITTGSSEIISQATGADMNVYVAGADMSGSTGELVSLGTALGSTDRFVFEQCRLGSGYTLSSGTKRETNTIELINCSTAVITTQTLGDESETLNGTTDIDTSRYRTGGADDGEQANPYSLEMVADANQNAGMGSRVLRQTRVLVGASSTTLTIYVAHNGVGSGTAGALQDDEFWVDVVSPDQAATAHADGHYQTTRPTMTVAATDITTDSGSTWNGTGVGTKQKIEVTIAPTNPGMAQVWLNFGPVSGTSTTIYVDYKIEVT